MIHAATVASQIMTRNLITLSPQCDLFQAVDILLKRRISGAPVVESNGDFIGIFSERSCMSAIVDVLYEGLPGANLMHFVDTTPPTITPETDLLAICQTFLDQGVRRLPVLEGRRLVGQVSRRDIMRETMSDKAAPRPKSELLYLASMLEDSTQLASRLG